MKEIVTLLLVLSSLDLFSQNVYYVKPDGNDSNNGVSWITAFKTLQKALAVASSGEVWVAAGTYYPDEGPGQTDNDRFSSFNLKTGVAIYGGFAGNETDTSQRNWNTNVTILSGDIDNLAGNSGNTYHVVRSASVNSTAIIDGFTITGGNADGNAASEYQTGGGMYNDTLSSAAISNCSFSGNTAIEGGGVYNNSSSSPSFFYCSFSGNTARDGGGIYNKTNLPIMITNCSITG